MAGKTNPTHLSNLLSLGCGEWKQNKPNRLIRLLIIGLQRFWASISENMNARSVASHQGFASECPRRHTNQTPGLELHVTSDHLRAESGNAMFEPSEPNSVNALVIKEMRADAEERTHRNHPPCYQWVTAILSLIFEENAWMVARPIKDSEARIQGKVLLKEPGLGQTSLRFAFRCGQIRRVDTGSCGGR